MKNNVILYVSTWEDPKSKLKYDMDICAKIALKEKNITEQCY